MRVQMGTVKTKYGEQKVPIVRSVVIKVFPPDSNKYRRQILRAADRKGFTMEDVGKVLEGVVEQIETQWPAHEYRMVQVGVADFNFICAGRRVVTLSSQPTL